MEDLGFIWSIPTSELIKMFQMVYDHHFTPEEMMDQLYLVSNRQYWAVDEYGNRTQIAEEDHFRIRAAQEDRALFDRFEDDDF